LPALGLGQPVRERGVGLTAVEGEYLERGVHVAGVDEEVEVLGVAPDAGVALERVGPADQERDVMSLQLVHDPPIEIARHGIEAGTRRAHEPATAGTAASAVTGISNTRKVGRSEKAARRTGSET